MVFTTTLVNRLVDEMGFFLNGGVLLMYAGTPPSNADDTTAAQPLAVIPLPLPAFAPAVGGRSTSNEIDPVAIVGTGDLRWAELVSADGAKLAQLRVRAVNDPDARPGDVLISQTSVERGGGLSLDSISLSLARRQ